MNWQEAIWALPIAATVVFGFMIMFGDRRDTERWTLIGLLTTMALSVVMFLVLSLSVVLS